MFLGWYDPNKQKTAGEKVADAVARYIEKFGSAPALCLTGATDARELGDETFGMPVRAVSYIGRHTYYVGVEGPSEAQA